MKESTKQYAAELRTADDKDAATLKLLAEIDHQEAVEALRKELFGI